VPELKDPNARLPYTIDWSDWLGDEETIAGAEWSISPTTESPLTIFSQTFDTTTSTVWLTGGKVGQQYRVSNHVTSSLGKIDDRSILIRVWER